MLFFTPLTKRLVSLLFIAILFIWRIVYGLIDARLAPGILCERNENQPIDLVSNCSIEQFKPAKATL